MRQTIFPKVGFDHATELKHLRHQPRDYGMETNNMDQKGFDLLKIRILKAIGLRCGYYRESYIQRRIKYRMRKLGINSYWEYWRYLSAHDDEYEYLIRHLAINYSTFFRDPDVFHYFQNYILPDILAKKKSLRILSAGCASGEEPYTIGIVINEALGPRLADFYIRIFAVDIDREAVEKAKLGEYSEKDLAGVNKNIIQRYFACYGNIFRINDNVRRLVRFTVADLTQNLHYQNLDIIFCRNVLIYFDKPGQEHLLKNFYNALANDGYLILGKAELLPEDFQKKFKCINPDLRIYQKITPSHENVTSIHTHNQKLGA